MEAQARLTIETHEDDSWLLNWNAIWSRKIRGSSRLNLRERESEEIARLIDASIGAIIKEMRLILKCVLMLMVMLMVMLSWFGRGGDGPFLFFC